MISISIIEDDQLISQMYRMKFEAEGFDVDIASTGEDGIAMVAEKKPTLILLDITLPDIDGAKVLEGIRRIPSAMATPVIVLTNLDDDSTPEKLAKWDIDDYIVKANYTPREVVAKVKALIAERRKFTSKSSNDADDTQSH